MRAWWVAPPWPPPMAGREGIEPVPKRTNGGYESMKNIQIRNVTSRYRRAKRYTFITSSLGEGAVGRGRRRGGRCDTY